MGYAQTRPAVLRSLVENVGVMMWRSDIAEETGLSEKSVLSAMNALLRTGQHNITVEARGNAWTYLGPAKATPKLAETRENTPLEREANQGGVMGRATKLLANAEYGKGRSFKEVTGVRSTDPKAVVIIDADGNLYRATPL